ncbi:hypothetical protein CIW68_16180 [Enterobacter cloacae]|nr:hypothetical protein CIW68_16180 [Enterobacter cloacae]
MPLGLITDFYSSGCDFIPRIPQTQSHDDALALHESLSSIRLDKELIPERQCMPCTDEKAASGGL